MDNDGDGIISQGDDIRFEMTVFNQGTLDATNVEITDYIPTGLVFNAGKNTDFVASGSNATTIISSIPEETSATRYIVLEVSNSFQGDYVVNNAEITGGTNALGQVDEDGDLATINGSTNDESELITDNDVDDEAAGTPGVVDNPLDVDDYDPVRVNIGQVFDLALTKAYTSFTDNDGNGIISTGDDVLFTITVYNQGTLDAYDVQISEYIPQGLLLNDAAWEDTDNDGIANLVTAIDDITVAEVSEQVTVQFTVDPTFQGTSITNVAEISFATNTDDSGINTNDIDSSADNTNDDIQGGDGTIDNENGDEDDHDPEVITIDQVFDLALDCLLYTSDAADE